MSVRLLNIFLFLFIITVSACKSDNDPDPIPTTLEITFLDGDGNAIPDVMVKLFINEVDLTNDINQIGTDQLTNAEGKVRYSNLKSVKYYWMAEKGCLNNINSSITTQDALTANRVNLVNSILRESANITLVNNSLHLYEFYLNGDRVDDILGQTTYQLNGLDGGSYTIRVIQLSGFVNNPTDLTYTRNLSCNNNATITFP